MTAANEYQPRTAARCIEILRAQAGNPRSWQAETADHIERLLLFLGEIAAMGPADEEWDADSLEGAVALATRALSIARDPSQLVSQ